MLYCHWKKVVKKRRVGWLHFTLTTDRTPNDIGWLNNSQGPLLPNTHTCVRARLNDSWRLLWINVIRSIGLNGVTYNILYRYLSGLSSQNVWSVVAEKCGQPSSPVCRAQFVVLFWHHLKLLRTCSEPKGFSMSYPMLITQFLWWIVIPLLLMHRRKLSLQASYFVTPSAAMRRILVSPLSLTLRVNASFETRSIMCWFAVFSPLTHSANGR